MTAEDGEREGAAVLWKSCSTDEQLHLYHIFLSFSFKLHIFKRMNLVFNFVFTYWHHAVVCPSVCL